MFASCKPTTITNRASKLSCYFSVDYKKKTVFFLPDCLIFFFVTVLCVFFVGLGITFLFIYIGKKLKLEGLHSAFIDFFLTLCLQFFFSSNNGVYTAGQPVLSTQSEIIRSLSIIMLGLRGIFSGLSVGLVGFYPTTYLHEKHRKKKQP